MATVPSPSMSPQSEADSASAIRLAVQIPVARPRTRVTPVRWIKDNFFRTWLDTIFTIIVLGIVLLIGRSIVDWAVNTAKWNVVTDNFRLFMQGIYPLEQSWRVALAVSIVIGLAGISWGLWGKLTLSTGIMFVSLAMFIIVVPLAGNATADLVANGGFARYFAQEIIPLVATLQTPIQAMLTLLIGGYVIGIVLKRINYRRSGHVVLILWGLSVPVGFILVRGFSENTPVLPGVSTKLWGGLLLTFMMAFVTIVACFPLGILLALGRFSAAAAPTRTIKRGRFWLLNPVNWLRSVAGWWNKLGHFPIIKLFSTAFIEFMRGIPLITVFFTANLIVPLALGGNIEIDGVIRAIIGMTLFEAAYIAEIVRGGLQALPPGQFEAARALGLSPVQATLFVSLPQALRLVIPSLVGQFITMFKDTSLAIIIGLLDLLGVAQNIVSNQRYSEQRSEALVFAALIYFVFSYGMSYAARQLERRGSGALRRT